MKRLSNLPLMLRGTHHTEIKVENHFTCLVLTMLLILHTGAQLSFPNMVCLHFSVTHRSTVAPVAHQPPTTASPL